MHLNFSAGPVACYGPDCPHDFRETLQRMDAMQARRAQLAARQLAARPAPPAEAPTLKPASEIYEARRLAAQRLNRAPQGTVRTSAPTTTLEPVSTVYARRAAQCSNI